MTASTISLEILAAETPLPTVPQKSDKDSRGRVLVIGGSPQVPGAVILTGLAAMRAGAGKLQFAAPADHCFALGLAVPEAGVIGAAVTAEGDFGVVSAPDLREAVAHADVVVIGPGMMKPDSSAALARTLLIGKGQASFVIDAAAMTGLSRDAPVKAAAGRMILTPHAGEMAHLMNLSEREVEANPLGVALEAARALGAVIVMKGATTYVTDPDGQAWVHPDGVVGLATSGSGDVLAGVIGGLLARGASPSAAARWAVCVHAAAGRRLSTEIGEVGFLARELLTEIPRYLRSSPAP